MPSVDRRWIIVSAGRHRHRPYYECCEMDVCQIQNNDDRRVPEKSDFRNFT